MQSGWCYRWLGHQGGAGGDQRRQAANSAPESHGGWGRGQPWGQSQGEPITQARRCKRVSNDASSTTFPLPALFLFKVIAAEGEMKASRALKEASLVIAESPSALQLRYLQTLNTIAAEKNSTIIFPLPIDIIHGFMKSWGGGYNFSQTHAHTYAHIGHIWKNISLAPFTQLDSPIMTHLVYPIKSFIHPLFTKYLCVWDYSKADMYWVTISVAECLLLDNLDNCNRYQDNNQFCI